MKLRTKIYMLALLPAVCIGLVSTLISTVKMKEVVTSQAYAGMQATAVSINNIFSVGSDGEYFLNEQGELCKGKKFNISSANELVDELKADSGFDVTIFYGDTRYLTTVVDDKGNRQVGTKASDVVVEKVLKKGENYGDDNVDVLGDRYICFYIPLHQEDSSEVVGMIFLGEKYSVFSKELMEAILQNVLICVILLIIAVVLAFRVCKDIVGSLNKGIEYVAMLRDGKLGFEVDKKLLVRRDIIGQLCNAVDKLNEDLASIMTMLKDQCNGLNENAMVCNEAADNLNDAITQISAVVEEVASTTASQAEDTEDVNKNVEIMGEVIEDVSEKSIEVKRVLTELQESMGKVEGAVTDISDDTTKTHASVEKISKATEMISSIAFQTKLLSLNASIEAARAGEFGKGFAVVATEIQQLAQSSEEVTIQIQEILEELCNNSEEALEGMQTVTEIVREQHEQVVRTQEIFTILNRGIGGDRSLEVDGETSLSKEREKIIQVVQSLASSSEEIAASMEQTAASAQQVAEMSSKVGQQAGDLNHIADVLSEQVNKFEVVTK